MFDANKTFEAVCTVSHPHHVTITALYNQASVEANAGQKGDEEGVNTFKRMQTASMSMGLSGNVGPVLSYLSPITGEVLADNSLTPNLTLLEAHM